MEEKERDLKKPRGRSPTLKPRKSRGGESGK